MSRAYTAKEVEEQFMEQLVGTLYYWLREDRAPTAKEKMEGMLFSILVMIDGGAGMPAIDLVPNPHPDDKKYHQENGENWYARKAFNHAQLHELLGHYTGKYKS